MELEKFARGEVADEAAICGEEIILGEFFEFDPLELVEDLVLKFAFKRGYGVELQVDCTAVAVVMADVGNVRSDDGADAEFFVEFAGESLLGALSLFNFPAGKLPLQGHWLIGAALADQDETIANQQSCNDETEGRSRRARVGNGLRVFHIPSVNAQLPRGCDRGDSFIG